MIEAIIGIISVLLGAGFIGIMALAGICVILAFVLKILVSIARWIFGAKSDERRNG